MSERVFQVKVDMDNLDRLTLGLNREPFLRDIFETDFKNNIKECACALRITPNYLREILTVETRGVGTRALSNILQYCLRSGREPQKYIFVSS